MDRQTELLRCHWLCEDSALPVPVVEVLLDTAAACPCKMKVIPRNGAWRDDGQGDKLNCLCLSCTFRKLSDHGHLTYLCLARHQAMCASPCVSVELDPCATTSPWLLFKAIQHLCAGSRLQGCSLENHSEEQSHLGNTWVLAWLMQMRSNMIWALWFHCYLSDRDNHLIKSTPALTKHWQEDCRDQLCLWDNLICPQAVAATE